MLQDNSFYLDLDNISLVKTNDSPIETKGFEASSTKICINDCISFSDTGTIKNYSWNWEFDGSLTASSTENNPTNICYPSIGTYDVTFISNYECGIDTIYKPDYIEVLDIPLVSIVDDSLVSCVGTEINLKANSTSIVVWNTGQTGNIITIEQSGTYIATSVNQCGIYSDTINKEFENCDCNIFFPKAFTPNGDASNEYYHPSVYCVLKSFNLSIRNRWGQELFSTNNTEIAWDGSYNGYECPSDVYVAICTYNGYSEGKLIENKIVRTVTLLR
jgi:gliding motility-associated-like protein